MSAMVRDERSKQQEFFPLLNKMYLQELLRDSDIEDFRGQLESHQ